MEAHAPVFDRWPAHLEGNIRITRDFNITVASYRQLYNAVGERWLWGDRRKLDDDALATIVYHPKVEIYRIFKDNAPAGYVELDFRFGAEVELAYCGLLPPFLGHGLGGPLLRHGLVQAFRGDPERVWLHTCSQDHPGAVGFYQHMGFTVYDREETIIDDPRALGLIPEHVAADRFPMVE